MGDAFSVPFILSCIISATGVLQLILTLKVTTAQVVETSMSTTTVLFRTSFTLTIKLNLVMKWLLVKPFTEELYVSKTVKENALASEANHADQKQSAQKNHYVCHDLLAWKKRWNKQYLVRGNSGVLPTVPLFTLWSNKPCAKYSREKFEKDPHSYTFHQFDSRNLIISNVPKVDGRGS